MLALSAPRAGFEATSPVTIVSVAGEEITAKTIAMVAMATQFISGSCDISFHHLLFAVVLNTFNLYSAVGECCVAET
jgi:hypothetical protein